MQRRRVLQRDAPAALVGLLALRVRRIGLAALALALSVAPRAFSAEPVRLEWVRLEGASECIDAASLEARVSKRLGANPFEHTAQRRIEGAVRREGDTWRAEIAVRAHPEETDPPLRTLKSSAPTCDSLGEAVVLAVALAIDPEATLAAPRAETSETATVAPASSASPPARQGARAALTAPSSTPVKGNAGVSGRVAVGTIAQVGLLPAPSIGASLFAGAQLTEVLELGIQTRLFPDVHGTNEDAFQVGAASGTVQVCAAAVQSPLVTLRGCGGASVGVLHGVVLSGERAQPGQRAWLGGELGAELSLPLTGPLAFMLAARAILPMTRYRFTVGGADHVLFREAAIGGIAQAGLQLTFGAIGQNR